MTLAIAIFTIATEAAKLKRVNPNKARGGGPGRRGRVVKKLRNGKGRQGRQLFGTRVPIFPATPLLPPAPLRAAPVFGPAPAPLIQPLQLIEVRPPQPRALPLVIPEPGTSIKRPSKNILFPMISRKKNFYDNLVL